MTNGKVWWHPDCDCPVSAASKRQPVAPPGYVLVRIEDAEKALAETRAEVVERIISAINHRVSGGGQWITHEKKIDVQELRSMIGYELAQNDESEARHLLGLTEGEK